MYERIAPLFHQWNTHFSLSFSLLLIYELMWLSIALPKLLSLHSLCIAELLHSLCLCEWCPWLRWCVCEASIRASISLWASWDWVWERWVSACLLLMKMSVCVLLDWVRWSSGRFLALLSPTLGISACIPLGWILSSERDANPIGVSFDCAPLYVLHDWSLLALPLAPLPGRRLKGLSC